MFFRGRKCNSPKGGKVSAMYEQLGFSRTAAEFAVLTSAE